MLNLSDWRLFAYASDIMWNEILSDELAQFTSATSGRSINVANNAYYDRAQQIRLLRTRILGTRPISDKRLTKRLDELESGINKLYKKVQKQNA